MDSSQSARLRPPRSSCFFAGTFWPPCQKSHISCSSETRRMSRKASIVRPAGAPRRERRCRVPPFTFEAPFDEAPWEPCSAGKFVFIQDPVAVSLFGQEELAVGGEILIP